jgi:hypothetical protein
MNAINPITPRTDTVVILQGDDDEELRRLQARAEALKPKKDAPTPPRTLDERDGYTEALAEAREFAAEAEERGVKVVLRALGRKTWRDLIAQHPPRDGESADKELGANADAFGEALVPLCMASPAGSPEECRAFLDSLNEGQFGDLAVRAWRLNMGRGSDPKALSLSEPDRS